MKSQNAGAERRYFDNAATSFPKPPGVAEAVLRCLNELGAAGRGAYAEAREMGRLVRRCRERINRLINGEDADHVVFGYNTTDALNLGIKGSVVAALAVAPPHRAVHVVTTWSEHNSVLRPLNALRERDGRVACTVVPADPRTGLVDPGDVRRAIRPGETALVAVNHASNVTGAVQDIEAIGPACREARALFLVDGAQSLGHRGLDVRAACVDLLAFPGHKGLLGPQGTGGLYVRPGVEDRVWTVREGGTGSVSEQETHPATMPERYEAGSHNAVGIAGLSEGVAWLLERGIDGVREHELGLMRRFAAALAQHETPGLTLVGEAPEERRVGVFSFVHETLGPAELATVLENEFGLLVRAGLHCAPLIHRALGTAPPAGAGAVRLSFGPFLTEADVEFAAAALGEICREHRDALAGVARSGR